MDKEKIDEEFVEIMLDIEKSYSSMNKHEKVRIEQWSKKLCQVTANPLWKKNRNKYAKTLLQLVKLGSLQEPFTKIPPEGPLPQFNGQVFIQPPKPRPKSSALGHLNRINNSDSAKSITTKIPENKIFDTPSFEKRPEIPKYASNKSLEHPSTFKPSSEKYDTRISISSRVNEDCIRLQTQVEILQINEKHLREELSKKNRKIQEQSEEIESLKRENDELKSKLEKKPSKTEFYEEPKPPYRYLKTNHHPEEEELLNIEDISHNLKRLEKLQEDLNRNKFS